jgi:hypothetical protein
MNSSRNGISVLGNSIVVVLSSPSPLFRGHRKYIPWDEINLSVKPTRSFFLLSRWRMLVALVVIHVICTDGDLFSYRDKFTLLYCDMLRYDIVFLAGGLSALVLPDIDNCLQMNAAVAVLFRWLRSRWIRRRLTLG